MSNELSCNTDTKKVWNVIKSLDGRNYAPPSGTPLICTKNERSKKFTNDKSKANAFITEYANVSRLYRSKTLDPPVKAELNRHNKKPCINCLDHISGMCAPFNLNELNKGLNALPRGKAEGPDNIPSEFLKNLGNKGQEALLNIVNS